ncbi:MAG: hypothetical protein ABI687_03005, partial [Flavitalea sp.]
MTGIQQRLFHRHILYKKIIKYSSSVNLSALAFSLAVITAFIHCSDHTKKTPPNGKALADKYCGSCHL